MPTLVYLIGGTYTGSVGTILAFIAVGAVYTLAIGLVARFYPDRCFVASTIFVFLNIPNLGATYTAEMFPLPVLALHQRLLDADRDVKHVERSLLYFGGLEITTCSALAWIGVIVALLLLSVSQKRERQHSVRREDQLIASFDYDVVIIGCSGASRRMSPQRCAPRRRYQEVGVMIRPALE